MNTGRNVIQICLFVVLAMPVPLCAQFTYITNNGAITITGYTGSGDAVTIPSTLNGLLVTSIGDGAFYGCRFKTVTIGTNVLNIGINVFIESSLTSVLIPASVTTIGSGSFNDCVSLTSVTIDNSIASIGEGAFGYCNHLTNVNIGTGIKSIGDYAF